MSGSGGDSGTVYSQPTEGDSCNELTINTQIATPQAEVIATLSVGDLLTIQISSDQHTVQILDINGKVAGNVISSKLIRLINCINNGTIFIAEVLSVDGGACEIQVRAQ
jgi:hypothetical protein